MQAWPVHVRRPFMMPPCSPLQVVSSVVDSALLLGMPYAVSRAQHHNGSTPTVSLCKIEASLREPCLTCSLGFNAIDTAAGWVNVVGLVSLLFMLISYIVLPVQHTRSHYLSVCLIVAVMMINLGFVVPLGADPDQCFDEITPNDQYSSLTCAWSGAFIAAGGLSATSWVLIRAFSMHLQICWDM